MAIDEAKLNEFMGNFVRDMGAVAHAATVTIGDQLGLYKALAEEPMTAEQLAKKTVSYTHLTLPTILRV